MCRQELIPAPLLRQYRQRYKTMYDRADIYVPFIEKSLDLLSGRGKLGFICSDRWMKNKYGGPLREKIAKSFSLEVYVDMVNTDAFLNEVSAYPAITVIGRGKHGGTRIAYRPEINRVSLNILAQALGGGGNGSRDKVREIEGLAEGSEP